ncbi:MAG TPA: hypothetical protein VFQ35_11800 [Polyangiaceae bacterium]|nr:hypothetical protein [Polyangiaceae bacterium]
MPSTSPRVFRTSPLVVMFASATTAACLGLGCETAVQEQSYELTLRVLSDPNEPLAGANASRGSAALGVSDEHGQVHVLARGREGERVAIDVACPDGYRSPEGPIAVTLRKVAGGHGPEYEVRCPPLRRQLVIAVRAERGANLPVRYLNREIGRTDEAGAALVMLESFTDDTLELTLDTSEEPRLLPRSPSTRFRMPDHDEIVVLNQRFELEPKAIQRVHRRKSAGPIRIQ